MDHVWNLGQNGFLYQDLHSRKSILLHQVVVLTTVSGKKKKFLSVKAFRFVNITCDIWLMQKQAQCNLSYQYLIPTSD